jgi:hypothetical protein
LITTKEKIAEKRKNPEETESKPSNPKLGYHFSKIGFRAIIDFQI